MPGTFEAVARELLWVKRDEWAPSYLDKVTARLENHVFPCIGNVMAADIKPPDLLAVLLGVEARGTIESAGRVRFGERLRSIDAYRGTPAVRAVLLLSEGYATGAILHEATGWPVAVCFDAGNLKPCALALHGLHPAALFLVCGDDDRGTEARTGTNPGRVKGAAAARAVRAAGGRAGLVLPEGLPDGATDFNDLAAHAGADALRAPGMGNTPLLHVLSSVFDAAGAADRWAAPACRCGANCWPRSSG